MKMRNVGSMSNRVFSTLGLFCSIGKPFSYVLQISYYNYSIRTMKGDRRVRYHLMVSPEIPFSIGTVSSWVLRMKVTPYEGKSVKEP